MKIICCGDWHIRATPTKYRTADYYNQMISKIKYIIEFANKNNIFTMLQPGDFFDNPDIPNRVIVDIIKTINSLDVYVVFGQHDLRHRRTEDTALSILIEDETVELLSDKPFTYAEKKAIDIYGASWDSAVPKVIKPKHYNILVLHKMIVYDKPLFPDQRDYHKSADFATRFSEYDLIISGDNHNSFSYLPKDKRYPSIINCGSLMRMTTAQYNHKPCFWVVDTISEKIKKHYIPILPITDVFKEEAAEIKERNEKMEAFIETLGDINTASQLSFETNVEILLNTQGMNTDVKKLTNQFIKEYYS